MVMEVGLWVCWPWRRVHERSPPPPLGLMGWENHVTGGQIVSSPLCLQAVTPKGGFVSPIKLGVSNLKLFMLVSGEAAENNYLLGFCGFL